MKLLIWNIRKKKNISIKKLIEITGISKGALYNYEKGIRYPSMLQMEKLAAALEVKINDLFESEYK
ncbi:MAG: family transcriptional regulator [Lachnospiraceae bacterium]|jgi:transcriptional regulator with XRE-family HTH domain|nr:family transcriptional regulator [Lachnospiraceae bacterium]